MLLASLTWTILGWTGGVIAILLLLGLLGLMLGNSGNESPFEWFFFTMPAIRGVFQLIALILAAMFRGGGGGSSE